MLDSTVAYGLTFLFPARDSAVGASLRRHGEFARPELDFLLEHAVGDGAFVDVGANIGAMALPFADQRPTWKVVAIEAHRGLGGVLAANALANGLYNVEIIPAAAGAAPGLAEFPTASLSDALNFGALGFGKSDAPTETVRVTTLDELAPADTRIIKIDVEGFEPEVLKGGTEILRRRTAIWLAEASVQNPQSSELVVRTFLEAGYSVHWFYAPFATPASPKDRPATPEVGDANVVALPPGAPNAWNLTPVSHPGERRPGDFAAYPYLARYGYS